MVTSEIKTADLLERLARKSLDELVSSLPILRDLKEPDNKEDQCYVLSVRSLDGILHAQFTHDGVYKETPVGFFYMIEGEEHRFSLSDNHQRVPLQEGSVVIPLTAHGDGVPVEDPNGNQIKKRDWHALGIKVDDKNVLPLIIYEKHNSEPVIVLCAEPEYGYVSASGEEHRREVRDVAEPVQIAWRQHKSRELRKRINDFVRKKVIPTTTLAVIIPFFGYLVAGYVKINYTEQPESTRIRDKITPVATRIMDSYLKSLEPYICLPVHLDIPMSGEYWLKEDFQKRSLDFYKELGARGFLPTSFDMRALRARNAGKSYRLDFPNGKNINNLVYTARDLASGQSEFFLEGRGVGGANPFTSSDNVDSFIMDGDGLIDLFITLKPGDYKSCFVARPLQSVYDAWLRGGYQWQDLPAAQMQRQVARELVRIARSPERGTLLPAK